MSTFKYSALNQKFTQSLEEAFPSVDPGVVPFGSRVLVQIRTPIAKTAGGIILTDDSRETDKWNVQTGKVVALGPVAFKNRQAMTLWPEGQWCQPGDYIRVPKYGGDRWEVNFGKGGDDRAVFTIVNDLDIIGRVTTDPRAVKAYV
jgi:co-chaperonin GroES (HSP10)